MKTISRLIAAAAVVMLAGSVSFAADPAATCESNKLGTSAKYASCRLKADAKTVKAGGGSADYSNCSLDKFTSAEDKAGAGVCPTEGDQTVLQSVLYQCTTRAANLVHGSRFVDNGDGTVSDNKTGLMWEKKTTAVGTGANYADPHDVDNYYSWSATYPETNPNGTVFMDFLAKLNGASDGVCYLGHCDWRLPRKEELEGIADATQGECGGGSGPCIDPVFGPTQMWSWSSTTSQIDSVNAWYSYRGLTYEGGKDNYISVRAVRAGY